MATGSSAGFVDVTMASMDASIRDDGHIGIESVLSRMSARGQNWASAL